MGETLTVSVNGVAMDFEPIGRFGETRRDKVVFCVACVAVLALAWAALATPAWAAFEKELAGGANWFYTQIRNLISGSSATGGPSDMLTRGFQDILGFTVIQQNGQALPKLYTALHNIKEATILPIASTLLSLVMLMQLLKISQKMDQTSQMPALKEVITLFIFCVFWIYLVSHSDGLLQDVYNIINNIGLNFTGSGAEVAWPEELGSEPSDFGEAFGLLISMLICWIAAMVANVAATVGALGRGIMLYLYMFIAPVAFTFLGFEHTRSWGIGFIKGFVSQCLAGIIMLVGIWSYPIILVGLVGSKFDVSSLGLVIACSGLLVLVIMNSDKYARELMGG